MILSGGKAYSDFRITNLLEKIKKTVPASLVTTIDARLVYFVDVETMPDATTISRMRELLGSSGEFTKGTGFFVTPRKGTISPWSSKATDIFHNAGLADIKRVERGIYFEHNGIRSPELIHLLFDRMTEGF